MQQVDLGKLEQWISRFLNLLPVSAGNLKRIFQRSGYQLVNTRQIKPARRLHKPDVGLLFQVPLQL